MKSLLNIKFLLLAFVPLFVSCGDDDSDNQVDRMFSPVAFKAAIVGNEVTLSWTPINNATYLLDISTDAEFENDLITYTIGRVGKYFVEGLSNSTTYYARIKAIHENSLMSDSKYSTLTFKTGIENIFKAINEDDISDNAIIITWDETKSVDRIVVSSAGNPDIDIALSNSEIATGRKTISGLNTSTSYTFQIYLGDRLRGTITAATTFTGFIPGVYNGSHTAVGSDPNFAIDGNEATYWKSSNTSKVYFLLDLRKKYDVTKIVLKWNGVFFPTTYDIVYSDTPFANLGLDGSNNLIGTTLTYTNPVGYGPVVDEIETSFTAQYVAVQTRGRNNGPLYSGDHYELVEFEVTGTPSIP